VYQRSSGVWNTLSCSHFSQRSLSPSSSVIESTTSHPSVPQQSMSPNNSLSESPLDSMRSFSNQYSSRSQPPPASPTIIPCTLTHDACTQTEPEIANQPSSHAEGSLQAKVTRSASYEEKTTSSKALPKSSQSLGKIHDANTKSNRMSRRSKSMKLTKV